MISFLLGVATGAFGVLVLILVQVLVFDHHPRRRR